MKKILLITLVFNFCINNAFLEIKNSFLEGAADGAISGINLALLLSLNGMLSTLSDGSFIPDSSDLDQVDTFYIKML